MKIGRFVEYKGYVGSIEYSSEDGVYHGKLLDIEDFINYEGNTVEELYQRYQESVDDYIEFKKEVGKE